MYGLNLDENKRILSACIVNEFTPEGIVKVDRLPEKEITDYLYIDNQYVYEPLPKILSKEQEKQRQHQTMKAMMEQEAQTAFLLDLPDEEAATIPLCYGSWSSFIGKSLKKDKRVEYDGKLYRVNIDIPVVLKNQAPSIETAYMYTVINAKHAGTKEDPIPYEGNMKLEQGKYYIQDGVLYECVNNSGNAVFDKLSVLVGIFVKEVKQ